jgi:hypothetical protein
VPGTACLLHPDCDSRRYPGPLWRAFLCGSRVPGARRRKVSLSIPAPRRYRRAQLHVAAFVAQHAAWTVRYQRPFSVAALDEPSQIQLDPPSTSGAIGGQPVTTGVQGGERVEGDRLMLAGVGAVRGHDATVARLACEDPVLISSSIVRQATLYERGPPRPARRLLLMEFGVRSTRSGTINDARTGTTP